MKVAPPFKSALLAVLVWTTGGNALAQVGTEERVAWLREHAVEVRSIAPLDEDFSDLAPLAATIGGARVVQLGEAARQGSGLGPSERKDAFQPGPAQENIPGRYAVMYPANADAATESGEAR